MTLGVAVDGEEMGDFEITLHQGDEAEARVEVGGVFLISLTEVTPFPVIDVETPRSDYAAQLVLSTIGAKTAVRPSSWGSVKVKS